MACLSNYTLQGIAGSCESNLAGVRRCWLGYADDYEFSVETAQSGRTVSISAATGATLHEYAFNRQTGSITSELNKDEANGLLMYQNTINLIFTRMEQSKHLEIEALAKEHLVGVVEDNNGEYHLFGVDGYLSLDTDSTTSGQAYEDLNGYTLSLSAYSAYKPIIISKALLNQMIGE